MSARTYAHIRTAHVHTHTHTHTHTVDIKSQESINWQFSPRTLYNKSIYTQCGMANTRQGTTRRTLPEYTIPPHKGLCRGHPTFRMISFIPFPIVFNKKQQSIAIYRATEHQVKCPFYSIGNCRSFLVFTQQHCCKKRGKLSHMYSQHDSMLSKTQGRWTRYGHYGIDRTTFCPRYPVNQ